MSCSLWRWTEECDSRPCPGDCDLCEENNEDEDDLVDSDFYRVDIPTIDFGVHHDEVSGSDI